MDSAFPFFLRMPNRIQHKLFLLILSLLLIVFYSNSFTAGWHFDDIPRIVINPNIHLTSLTWDSLLNTLYSLDESPNKLYRPVTNLTLALNWLISHDDVFGYHLVNLTLHFLTGLFLYRTLLLLYQTRALLNTKNINVVQVPFFAVLLWAIHPMHTQAVTYIVQRMCVMAALFSVLGMLSYVKFRLSTNRSSKKLLLASLLFCFLLAIGSKENAILLPANLLLIEIVFFYDSKTWRKYYITILAFGIVSTIILFIFLAHTNYWQEVSILQAYQNRFFTIQERLLTETRIIISYLSQLFYPIPQRLSIAHDIQISQSLIDPFSTLLSVIFIGILLFIAVIKIPKWPIFSFSILFFFLNHLIESTIIPLELIFEHRNYLPSLFLFWPVSVFFCTIVPSLFTSKWLEQFILKPALPLLILLLGVSTLSRNSSWQTDASLWQDAHDKAPGRARPVYYLGVNAEKAGNIKEALEFYQTAISLTDPSPVRFRSLTYSQIAELQTYLTNYNGALDSYEEILALEPDSAFPVYKLAETWFSMGNIQLAETYLRQLINRQKAAEKTHALLGKILLESGRTQEALGELANSLQAKQDQETAIDFAIALTALERYHEAKQVTHQFIFQRESTVLPAELLQLVIQVATKEPLAEKRTNQLLSNYPLTAINETLQRFSRAGIFPDFILPVRLLLAKGVEHKLENLFSSTKNEK